MTTVGFFISFRGKGLRGIDATDHNVMSAPKKGEITGAQFAREARMIIAGMVNSQTVLLTVAPKQQPYGVQVVEWVGLIVFFRFNRQID